nr:transposase [Streptomyces olivoreticuli]
MTATGITEDGGRKVLGVMVGDSETEAFWTDFLRRLHERGLSGAVWLLAGHDTGLVAAIRKVMISAAYRLSPAATSPKAAWMSSTPNSLKAPQLPNTTNTRTS